MSETNVQEFYLPDANANVGGNTVIANRPELLKR